MLGASRSVRSCITYTRYVQAGQQIPKYFKWEYTVFLKVLALRVIVRVIVVAD